MAANTTSVSKSSSENSNKEKKKKNEENFNTIEFQNDFNLSNNNAESHYDDIINNNKEIQKLRNELDLKLKDLNDTSDSRFKNYKDTYNYELLLNITWSILAVSIIYFVFVKL
jgi:hypothetical protein